MTQPGQIERQFQRPPEPDAKPGAISIPEAGQKPPENADGITIRVTELTIDGSTAYSQDALRATYQDVLNRDVPLTEIYRIVERLTARYRNDGYILSQVYVPAQTVEDGSIHLQAVEGYIASVRVEGGSDAVRNRVRTYGDKIRAARPLTMAALERYVLLINDLPGVAARAVLAPSTVPGASDLVLQVTKRRIDGSVGSDNRGSQVQGPGRLYGDLDFDSMFLGTARTELRGVSTLDSQLVYVAAARDQYVGSEGGIIGIAGSLVYSKPKEVSVIPLDLTTQSWSATAFYSHPLIRRRSHNLRVRGTFAAFNSTTTVFGIDDTIDRVRSLSAGFTYDSAGGFGGINLVDVTYAQGLPGLGASSGDDQLLSRPTGRADFRKATLYVQRLQPLGKGFSILAGGQGQYAFTDLLTSEMFSVGGEMFGRGYDPSALLNDHGAAVKVDLRYTRFTSGRRPAMVMPYAFGDWGTVWQRTPYPGIAASQSAWSAGGGVRASLGGLFSGFIEVARPFDTVAGQNTNHARVFAGVTLW